MSLNRTAVLAASLMGVMAFAVAHAQATSSAKAQASESAQKSDQADQSPPTFEQLDRNHDGRITRSEIPHSMHALREHFMQYDQDGNGSLSKKEYEMYAHPPRYERRP